MKKSAEFTMPSPAQPRGLWSFALGVHGASSVHPEPTRCTARSRGSRGSSGGCGQVTWGKNDDLPIENGDLPIENGDLPIENRDLPIDSMVIFHSYNWYNN